MNKKILALGLSMTFILSIGNNAYAKDNPSDVPIASTQKEDTHTYLYEVIKLEDEKVKLLYQGEITEDSIMMEEIYKNTDLELDREFFEEDVIIHDRYEITSNKTLSKLDSKDIKKDDVKLKRKYEKPKNMAKEDLPANTESMDFVIENLKGNTEEGFAAIVSEVGNENNKYSIFSDNLRDDNPKVGDQYTIYWDGVTLESYPAQFGKIFRVEKLVKDNENQKTIEFEIDEIVINKDNKSAIVFETGNKTNVFSIDLEDLKDENAKAGDRYEITWNGIATKSIPAQFGEIYEVKKTFDNKEELKETAEFELVDITDSKEGKDANLKKSDSFGEINLRMLSELEDDNAKIGDKYLITYTKDQLGHMGIIEKVEKVKNEDDTDVKFDELKKTVDEAGSIVLGDGTFTKESADRFQKAFENAKEILDKADASQEEVDKASKELREAMDGLSEKTGVITRQFVLTEIGEKAGKFARLTDSENKDVEFTIDFESLGDPNAKVGDIYNVTMEHVDPNESPYQMGKITKIEKVPNYGRLIDAIEKAKKAYDKNKTYTKESLAAYNKAFETAQDMIAKNSLDSPENVDKAANELEKAAEGLKEVKKETDKKETPKENKKAKTVKGWNPSTGITPVAPLLAVIAGAGYLLKRKK
ncbi:methyl-accepting chemotaxis domain-containing protein [Anaerococcus provencensis]|uniref:FIVAR domain-containing protein n=1 Tax=Anaerococcus provencensis TaxID=938293 RepID=UPI000318B07B|nr:FIVAR domain-containing protein [Anaerococcus provencensis]